jgi:sec-independent protein translocase protein TatA
MSIGIWQIAIIVLLLVLLFGRGKISELMGDVAKGIKSFKKGLSDEETASDERKEIHDIKAINHEETKRVDVPSKTKSTKVKS